MKINSYQIQKYFVLMVVVCIALVSCESEQDFNDSNSYAPFISLSTPDPNLNAEILLFKSNDFPQWDGSYTSSNQTEYPLDEIFKPESVIGASMYPKRSIGCRRQSCDPRRAIQSVEIYKNVDGANAAFRKLEYMNKDLLELNLHDHTENFTAVVENVHGGCMEAYGRPSGNYLNCNVWFQSGIFVIHGSMHVDNNLLTLDDWESFINVLQDRLVAYPN